TAPFLSRLCAPPDPPSFPTRRSSDLAELGRVGDCEIDFALGRHSALESHPVGLGHNISMAMLREIKALLLRQCRLQIARLADQAGLALLADSAFEERFNEDQLVPVDESLDLVFRGIRTQDFGCWEVHMREQAGPMEHASDVHSGLPESGETSSRLSH